MHRLGVLGHVDCGKSTLIGRLFYDSVITTQNVSGDDCMLPGFAKLGLSVGNRSAWDRIAQEAANLGKASFKYAFCCDVSRDERERGISIHRSVSRLEHVQIYDSPGHTDFKRTMACVASCCDSILLVVSAARGEFEVSIQRSNNQGWQDEGNVVNCIKIIRGMGVKRVIVAVNKLDQCDQPESRFKEVQRIVVKALKKWQIGSSAEYSSKTHREFPYKFRLRLWTLFLVFKRMNVGVPRDIKVLLGKALCELENPPATFIPVSAWEGHNTVLPGSFDFYKGPTLLQVIRGLPSIHDQTLSKRVALKFHVLNHYVIRGVGHVLRVKVQAGTLMKGQHLEICDSDGNIISVRVKSLECDYKKIEEGFTGMICSIGVTAVLPGPDSPQLCENGSMGWLKEQRGDHDMPFRVFDALVFSEKEKLKLGQMFNILVHTTHCKIRITKILWHGQGKKKQEMDGLSEIPARRPAEIRCEVVNNRGLCCTAYDELPAMSRFVFYFGRVLVGVGHVTTIH